MSALEQEVIEKFYQLDQDTRARVRAVIERETDAGQPEKPKFDYVAWFRDVEAIRQKIAEDHGGVFPSIDAIEMLREIRNGEDDE